MGWDFMEAVRYYQTQGAPREQMALVGLLREVQQEYGGIPGYLLREIAEAYQIKESFLQAIIRRMPGLRLADTHCLELCAGPNCGKHAALAALAEERHRAAPHSFTLRYVPCMRLCGKGPNIRWDGTLYHHADQRLLNQLLQADEVKK